MSHAAATNRTASAAAPVATAAPRPPYLAALVAGIAVFALYAITLAPTTAFWDTSEYIATAHILGIPHPPGNPLFVIMARAWEVLLAPFGITAAIKINLFSAVMGAGTAYFWFLMSHRILTYFTPDERVRRAGAGAAVLLSATAFTVWNQSNVNEKVYTLSMLTIAFLSWLAFLWRDHVEAHRDARAARGWHDDNVIVLMVYLLALSVANHLMAFLAFPALLVFLVLVKPRVLLNWRIYPLSLVFGVVALTVHMFLPLRSGLDPIINQAAPTCPSVGSALHSIVTYGEKIPFPGEGCPDLSASLNRDQYQKPSVFQNPIYAPRDYVPRDGKLLASQIVNYLQYFDWQWARSISGNVGFFGPFRPLFTLLFAALGIFGALEHWRRDRKSFAYVAVLFATLSLGLTFYMNFRYGYGQARALGISQEMSEVRERDYFFLVSFSLWGLWSGIGITALWLGAMEALKAKGRELRVGVTGVLGAVALIPLVLNWEYASRRDDYAARDFAYNLLQSVEPYGVLFTNGDNDTFPLWYLQEVEGLRKDVTVIVMSYLNTHWYAQQLRDLSSPCPAPGAWKEQPTRIVCQRPFHPANAPRFYGNPKAPARAILPYNDQQIRAIADPGYMVLGQDETFTARGISAVLPKGAALTASDQFALTIVKHAWGDRPIFFAGTTNVFADLGLAPYVARQGMAYKLVTPEEAARMTPMPPASELAAVTGAFMDVDRHRALLTQVLQDHGLTTKSRWPDDATRNIPMHYAYAFMSLAQAEQLAGRAAAAQQAMERANAWVDLAQR